MPYYDHDKDYPFAAFITNLGKYNEGKLVGEWVKFPTTAEVLNRSTVRPGNWSASPKMTRQAVRSAGSSTVLR